MTLSDYNDKLNNRQLKDISSSISFMENNGREITEDDFFEYFYLFKDEEKLSDREIAQIERINNEKIKHSYSKNIKFDGFHDLLNRNK